MIGNGGVGNRKELKILFSLTTLIARNVQNIVLGPRGAY